MVGTYGPHGIVVSDRMARRALAYRRAGLTRRRRAAGASPQSPHFNFLSRRHSQGRRKGRWRQRAKVQYEVSDGPHSPPPGPLQGPEQEPQLSLWVERGVLGVDVGEPRED